MNTAIIDTHIFLWLMEGDNNLSSAETTLIESIIKNGQLLISPISLWEIAMLQNLKKISLSIPITDWIQKSTKQPGIKVTELDINILIESVYLPGAFHKDPADRIIVATARTKKIPLITHDTRIISYAKDGYVQIA